MLEHKTLTWRVSITQNAYWQQVFNNSNKVYKAVLMSTEDSLYILDKQHPATLEERVAATL